MEVASKEEMAEWSRVAWKRGGIGKSIKLSAHRRLWSFEGKAHTSALECVGF